MADQLRPQPPALDAVNMGGLESVGAAWQTLADRAAAWPDGEATMIAPGGESGEWQGASGERARDAGRDFVGVANAISTHCTAVVSAIGEVKSVVNDAVPSRQAVVDEWRQLCAQYPAKVAALRAEAEASGDRSKLTSYISRSEQSAAEFKSRLSTLNERLDAVFDQAKNKLVSAQEALDSVANQCRGKRDALGDTTKVAGLGELDAATRAQLRALIGASRDPALAAALGAWQAVGVKDLIAYAVEKGKLDQAMLDAAKVQYDAYLANPAAAAGQTALAAPALLAALVQPGASGNDVVAIQQYLVALGLLAPDLVDGQYGPITAAAVRSFQQGQNITVDGVWGPQSQGSAVTVAAATTTTTSGSVLDAFASLATSPDAPSAGQWTILGTYADDPLINVDSALQISPPLTPEELAHVGVTEPPVLAPTMEELAATNNWDSFARALLVRLDAPITQENVDALMTWMMREQQPFSPNQNWNPLNIRNGPGGSFGPYPSFEAGVNAIAYELDEAPTRFGYRYDGVVDALRQGTDSVAVLDAIQNTPWCAGSYAGSRLSDTLGGVQARRDYYAGGVLRWQDIP